MPDFGNPFSGNRYDRNITTEELIRALRFSIAAEYEAIQLYTQLADSINDEKAEKVLRDIAEEEVVHAGEFLRLLVHFRPKEFESYLEGIKETEDLIKNASYHSYHIKNEILYWKAPNGKEIPIQVLRRRKSPISKIIKTVATKC